MFSAEEERSRAVQGVPGEGCGGGGGEGRQGGQSLYPAEKISESPDCVFEKERVNREV